MDEQQQTPPEPEASGPDTSAGPEPSPGRSFDVQQMVAQLQGMIEQVATQATPALREVAAKAAELAASAAVHAGPLVHKVAEGTDRFGQAVAERSSKFASDLRHGAEGSGGEAGADDAPAADAWTSGAPSPDADAGTGPADSQSPGDESTPTG